MIDQANRLRDIIKAREEANNRTGSSTIEKLKLSSRVITITSGKGGVGKTNLTVNLAIQLAKLNKRVVIIDADFGLANIELLFGIVPKCSFSDVLSGNKTMEEILTNGPMDIKFLSGGSGLANMANITDKQMSYILDNFSFLDSMADIVLIDTGAGISKSVVNFIKASGETIIITTPEPTSVTDAYSIIKTIKEEKAFIPEFKVVVNRVDDYNEGQEIYNKLNKVSERFLNISLKNLGSIPYDNNLVKAVKRQEPVSICFPNTSSTKSIENISRSLLEMETNEVARQDGIKSFVKRLVNIFGS